MIKHKHVNDTTDRLSELKRDYEDAALKLFLFEKAMEDTRGLLAEKISPEADKCARDAYPRLSANTRRALRRRGVRRLVKKALPGVLKGSAVTLLFAYISFTIALATSSEVRRYVSNMITVPYQGHVSIGYENNRAELNVPKDWKAFYYPAYIPDGYILTDVSCSSSCSMATFFNVDVTDSVIFHVHSPDCRINVSTENCTITKVTIRGCEATFIVRDEEGARSCIYWAEGDSIIMLSCADAEELLKVALSVTVVH